MKTIKRWWRKLKTIQRNRRISHAPGLEELILLKWPYYPKQSIDLMQSLSKLLSWFWILVPLLPFRKSYSPLYFSPLNSKERFWPSSPLRAKASKLSRNKVELFISKVRAIYRFGQWRTCFGFYWCAFCLSHSSFSFYWWVVLLRIEYSHTQLQS